MKDTITLKPRGKITSENVGEWKQTFLSQIGGAQKPDLMVDMSEVYYISSAGLRLMMTLREMASGIHLKNVSPDVYDVFSVTGLTEILDVRRLYKDISCRGLKVLGKGATATVYRLNDEQIVKVYNKDVSEEDLLLEQDKTRKALLAGVPTMLSFETVIADESLGAIYEAFNFETLLSVYKAASDEKRKELTKQYARMICKMCSIKVNPEDFQSFKHLTRERLEKVRERLDEKTFAVFEEMIGYIPDNRDFIHGDCHMGNLMMDPEGNLMVIDLGISGYGNPVFALSGVARYKVFAELITDEEAFKNKAELSIAEGEELYHRFIAAYCDGQDEKKRELLDVGVCLYCRLFSILELVGTPLVTDETFRSVSDRLVKEYDTGFDYAGIFQVIKDTTL